MVFRAGGIYCLPNGRELVVLQNDEEGLVLFGAISDRFEMDEFSVNEAGRLIHQGKLTAWDTSNLSDTGRTAMGIPSPFNDRAPQPGING